MTKHFPTEKFVANRKSLFWLLFAVMALLVAAYKPLPIKARQNVDSASTTPSVVRIRAQKCDKFGCIDNKIGSGVIIHPGGLILTAWHVTVIDEFDTLSAHLDRFVIEIPDNVGLPKPKYQAKLIADLPEQDLAFLQITSDENGKLITPTNLPYLSISQAKPKVGDELLLLGYPNPLTQNPAPSVWHRINRIVQNDIALDVVESLQQGYSGGPALITQQGRWEVVGVISALDLNSAQTVHVQGLSGLTQIHWASDPNSPAEPSQAWCEKVEILSINVKGVPTLRIMTDLYALNIGGQTGRLLAYAYDAKTHRPLKVTDSTLPHAPDGQLALYHDFDAQHYLDKFELPIEIAQKDLNLPIPLERLLFRLVVVGSDSQRLWEGEKWYSVTIVNPKPAAASNGGSAPAPPTPTPTATLITTLTATPLPTSPPPTSPPPVIPSGRIAFPLLNKGKIDIGIYCFSTQKNCQRLSTMRQPDMSAGGYLVVNGDGGGRESLFRMGPNYEHQEPVSLHPEDGHPQWSPDGLNIVFDSTSYGEDNLSRIYWQEKTNRQPTDETQPIRYAGFTLIGRAPVYLANWHVAYNGCDSWETWSHCGIYTVEHRGREKPIRVTDNPNDIPTDGLGDRVLFMANRQASDWEIYVANWNEFNSITQLTNSPGCNGLATASPDGQYIAFMTNREGHWSVYVMRPDGSDQTKLFDIPEAGFGCGDAQWLDERMSWGP